MSNTAMLLDEAHRPPTMLTKLRMWLNPTYTFVLFIPGPTSPNQEPGIVAIERNGELISDINDWPEFWITVVDCDGNASLASTNKGRAAPIAASFVEGGLPPHGMTCIQVTKGCRVLVMDERAGTATLHKPAIYGHPLQIEVDWGEAHLLYGPHIEAGDYNALRALPGGHARLA